MDALVSARSSGRAFLAWLSCGVVTVSGSPVKDLALFLRSLAGKAGPDDELLGSPPEGGSGGAAALAVS